MASTDSPSRAEVSTTRERPDEVVIDVVGAGKIYEPSPRWLGFLLKSAIDEPVVALDDVTFQVRAGQICAVVGPNGAGKSTLFRILTGLTTPTSGTATVGGLDCEKDSVGVRRLVGFMPPEDRSLFLRHDCVENLRFHGRMHGMDTRTLNSKIDETLELVGLGHARHRAGFALSSGMRSRLQLGCAILHRPKAVVLDEPTGAIDPIAAREFLDVIELLAREGMAVLLSSHRLEEIEALDDNLILISQGRLAYSGDLADMRRLWERPRQKLGFSSEVACQNGAAALRNAGLEGVESSGDELTVFSEDFGQLAEALGPLVREIVSVAEVRLSLRDLLGIVLGQKSSGSAMGTGRSSAA